MTHFVRYTHRVTLPDGRTWIHTPDVADREVAAHRAQEELACRPDGTRVEVVAQVHEVTAWEPVGGTS